MSEKEGVINLAEISHHDLAWVEGSFDAEIRFVNNEINKALETIAENPEAAWSHELAIFIREFLKSHPQRYEELKQQLLQGRFEIGAGYSSPYTSAIPAEALVRQFIYGKKWVDDTFPGYHAAVYYNTDVPGMTAQFPQILAKADVRYLYASRSWNFPGFDHTEMKKWRALDGTEIKTLFLNHYGNAWGRNGGDIRSDAYLLREVQNFRKHREREKLGNCMPLIYSSDSIVSIDFSERLDSWNAYAAENNLPPMTYSTVQHALEQVFAGRGDFSQDTLEGEWPNTWFYESNPADYEAYKQHKTAERLLRSAETLSVIRAVVTGSFADYPSDTIRDAWLALEMLCHGYAPRGAIEDFEASYRRGYALASSLYEKQLLWLVSQVSSPAHGTPVVIWNSLSWKRSDFVELERPEGSSACRVLDPQGKEIPNQMTAAGKLLFRADAVPSMGYAVYTLLPAENIVPEPAGQPWTEPAENAFYRLTPKSDGTLAQITDLETGKDLFDTSKFGLGQILLFQYDGLGAGEHLNMWQPHHPQTLDVQKPWSIREKGAIRTVFETSLCQKDGDGTAVLQIGLYHDAKKITFDVTLEGFGEGPKNQVRMMFPAAMESMFGDNLCADGQKTQVTYEVPFGAVRVGDEVLHRFSHFNDNTGDPNATGQDMSNPLDFDGNSGVRPRNIQNWIRVSDKDVYMSFSSLNLGWDYQDATPDPVQSPVLQPVLLSVSKSCHGGYGYWEQPGSHTYHFAMTSGTAEQAADSDRPAIAENAPLDARIQTETSSVLPAEASFFGADADHIRITAVKQAEDIPGAIILRWYETRGQSAPDTVLRLPENLSVLRAEEVNLIERPTGDSCRIRGQALQTETSPWSIRTVLLHTKK